MNKDMTALVIGLIAKVGLQAALDILTNIKNATTIDEAIVALQKSAAKDWSQFKAEV